MGNDQRSGSDRERKRRKGFTGKQTQLTRRPGRAGHPSARKIRKRGLNEPGTARNEPEATGANQRVVGRDRSNSERSRDGCRDGKQPGKRRHRPAINRNRGGRCVLIAQKTTGVDVLVRQRRFAAGRPLDHRRVGNGCRVGQISRANVGAVLFGQQQRFGVAAHLTPMIDRARTHAAQQDQSGQPATDKTG